jgi:hypothetical protein
MEEGNVELVLSGEVFQCRHHELDSSECQTKADARSQILSLCKYPTQEFSTVSVMTYLVQYLTLCSIVKVKLSP